MKVYIQLLTLFTVIVLLVSGCGSTSEKKMDQTNGVNEDITQDNGSTSKSEHNHNGDSSEEHIRILEQNLIYKEKGIEKKETAFLKYSDNQDFSIYVLPDFELSAEEPYKDILYLHENGSIFMRIELLPNDVDWNLVKEETNSQLMAVSSDIRTQTAPEDDFFKDVTILEASNEKDVVTSYLINNEDLQMKLTMFTTKEEDYRDVFLQMAKTIMKETNKKAG